jgi:type IV secretory pathway VirB2 component (pilin)
MNARKIIPVLGVLLLASAVNAWTPSAGSWNASVANTICDLLDNLRGLLQMIAGAVATLIIVMNGVKWIGSSDDPGARKQAKEGIVHAVVGLVIVLIAVNAVTLIYGASCT